MTRCNVIPQKRNVPVDARKNVLDFRNSGYTFIRMTQRLITGLFFLVFFSAAGRAEVRYTLTPYIDVSERYDTATPVNDTLYAIDTTAIDTYFVPHTRPPETTFTIHTTSNKTKDSI